MSIVAERFYNFIKKDTSRSFLAFVCYILFVSFCTMGTNFPPFLTFSFIIAFRIVFVLGIIAFLLDIIKIKKKNISILESMKAKFSKIINEITIFFPIAVLIIVFNIILSIFFVGGIPTNQEALNVYHKQAPILSAISTIIIAPIKEEIIFRLLPSKFIKNKILYIIVSSTIFAAIHVFRYPKPFIYIWFYIPLSLYLGYRYYKTKDIYVTIFLHSFYNLL